LRSYESAIASRFGFSRKKRRPATFDFCNTIGTFQTWLLELMMSVRWVKAVIAVASVDLILVRPLKPRVGVVKSLEVIGSGPD
jgi:hypothetical protein